MKVLLSDTWAGGGASTFVGTLGRGLSMLGHDVDVVVGYRDSPAVEDYAPYVRRVHRPPYDFDQIVLQGNYDVLHVTEDDLRPPFDYGWRVRRVGLRTRVVVTAHQEYAHIADGAADAVVYVSEASLAKTPSSNTNSSVIANGVDAAAAQDLARESLLQEGTDPAAVWVGRVEDPLKQKDFLGFMSVVPALLDAGWRVLILDGSPESDVYPVRDDLIRWFGNRVAYANQVPRALVLGALSSAGRSGGALVSTSRYEAAPFIALEALAVGCPVLVPEITGYAALLDGGYVTSYETSYSALRDALLGRVYARHLVEVPEELSADHMVQRYLAVYRKAQPHPLSSSSAHLMRLALRLRSHPAARSLRDRSPRRPTAWS